MWQSSSGSGYNSKVRVLLVDPLCGERGHLIHDDHFLTQCIIPLASRFAAVTSKQSLTNMSKLAAFPAWATPPVRSGRVEQRLRLFRIAASLPSTGYNQLIFQSFEELSALFYMITHPGMRVHLIVTNNLQPIRLERHPCLGSLILDSVLTRASSIIVHSQFEVQRIRSLAPRKNLECIYIKPFHQLAAARLRLPWKKRTNNVLFLGPALPHKPIAPVLDLLRADTTRRYRYVFCRFTPLRDRLMMRELRSLPNVELRTQFEPDNEYYQLIAEAAAVILTHDRGFEGATSGPFCDAISSGTPVITRIMAPATEYWERFGPMGILVDYEKPGWYVPLLEMDLCARYSEYQENMAACRASSTIESVRRVFASILSSRF